MVEVFAIVLLVLANGLFAGAEIAIVSMDRARLRQRLEEGSRRARAIKALRGKPESFFATVQIVITVVGATAGALGGAGFAGRVAPLIEPLVGGYAQAVALALVVGIISYLSLVLGELVPKSLALRYSERYALFVAPLLVWVASAVRPLVWFLTASSNTVLRFFGDKATFTESRMTPDQLRELVEEAAETGTLSSHVSEIATRALEFGELTVSHTMIPRTRVIGIPLDATIEKLQTILQEYPHTRFPVFRDGLDDIVGYVLTKDLLGAALARRSIRLPALVRKPYFIVESAPAATALEQMRRRRTHLAVVVDESGGTSGIVTLDDLLEELVGEILGERHPGAPVVRQLANGSAITSGEAQIRDVNRELDLELPEGDAWSTIGGLSMALAEGIPKAGQVLDAPGGTRLYVEGATDRAVTRVRIIPAGVDDPFAGARDSGRPPE